MSQHLRQFFSKLSFRAFGFLAFVYAALFAALFLNAYAYGQNLQFNNLSQDQLRRVVGDLSSNFHHTSVSGANTLGSIFGFEVGLLGGVSSSPEIDRVVKDSGATDGASRIYNAALLGVLTIPFGLTGEVGFVPQIGSNDFKFQSYSGALKWTATETVLSFLPLSLAVKGHMQQSTIEFRQPVTGGQSNGRIQTDVMGLTLLASKNLMIIEPYVGVGFLRGNGDLSVAGSSTVFNFTTSSSANETRTSGQFLLGAELKLLVIKFGLEYANQFGTDRYTGKLSFFF